MATRQDIRHRLITILLLGALTSALSLIALVRLYSISMAQRVERARDSVTETADRLADRPASLTEPAPNGVVGVRAGTWDGESPPPGALPEAWIEAARAAVKDARAANVRVTREATIGDSTLVVAACPNGAFAAYMVNPLTRLQAWLWIIVLLALVTVLLVATSVYAMVTVNRGAAALRASLTALATDLHAPIPRPRVRELADIADGIARLAENLIRAREEQERLGRELSERERLAALGRVAAGVAHEVRNPLASIKLRLDLAATSLSLPPSAESAIAHASSEIARLDRLVADLLVVAGRAIGEKRVTSLGGLVRARVEALAPWAKARGVTVEASGDAACALDADSMARAIDNLLRNAVEASPDRGVVRAQVVEQGAEVVLRVEDLGAGVQASRVAELFEPFFTTKPEGTGLGLAISRAIARAHGGELEYTREGKTTCFELRLGAAQSRREAAE